jgi:uncharacterized protein with HEPN domain
MRSADPVPRLTDMLRAIERVRRVVGDADLDTFAADWQIQWLVERGIEIVSEASRHLPAAIKARHPTIPWNKVAGIGNILRHDYERVAPPIIWALVRENLPPLEIVCRAELDAAASQD